MRHFYVAETRDNASGVMESAAVNIPSSGTLSTETIVASGTHTVLQNAMKIIKAALIMVKQHQR